MKTQDRFFALPFSARWPAMLLGICTIVLAAPWIAHGQSHKPSNATSRHEPTTSSRPVADVTKLPPLPAGVTELKFNDFFVKPVGPRGLQLTEKLRGLDGQRVRILGYMAHRETQPPATFLFTPYPVEIHDHDNSLAEDFPASVVQVNVPTLRDQQVPHVRGLMLLTGLLSVGNQPEADGRVSIVRLELDPPEKYARTVRKYSGTIPTKGAQVLRHARPTP